MKKNMKRLNSYTLIATALLSLAACNRGDGDFDATGTFEATEILVSSEANGKIMELNIEEGDRLDAGALWICRQHSIIFEENATLGRSALCRYP